VIVRSPADLEHAYVIRFPDGGESALKHSAFRIRKHFQSEGMDGPRVAADDPVLRDSVIYGCVIGSRAYGLDREGSCVCA
jgi:hypothetical protein